jgi:hypothetical protein
MLLVLESRYMLETPLKALNPLPLNNVSQILAFGKTSKA